MPLPERVTSDDTQPDAELLQFIDRRRQREARRRRQLLLFGIAAGMIVLALGVTTWLVVARAPRATTPVATGPPSPAAPAPTPPRSEAVPAPAVTPRTGETTVPPAAGQPRAADAQRPEPAAPDPPPPARSVAPRPAPSDVPPARWVEVRPAAPDSVQRAASYLVQTHGRQEAETRAATVAEFYSGEQRAFWRRVLAEIRRTPEP